MATTRVLTFPGLVGHLRIHRTEAGEPDPSQVWWYAQGRLRPRQPHVTSLISGLLACVVRPGSGGGGEESAGAAPATPATCDVSHFRSSCLCRETGLRWGRRRECALRLHKDWFDDNDADIGNLLAEKNGLHEAYMDLRTDGIKAAFMRGCRLVQQWQWEMQDAWMIRKAKEIQGYADQNEIKNIFKAIKGIYGQCIKGIASLLSSDGITLLTEKSQILKRWAEHFRSVLNCSSAISSAAIVRLPQVDMNNDLDLPPSLRETIRAMQQISSGKSPGSNAI
ncbi:unnamed protein product [Schistocephalus solidus]|uniref:Uncharacterized protein n=1 Tax=Schistocephalus solidus TaxID=70667 RepID=A0A183SYY5_SCHSO|nr:unnamed protein product [Schistocephalus solidus]